MAEFKVSTDLSVVRGLQITANFDELKAELTQKVESYRQMVVTPETTAAAKADLANLRRVQKDIDTVRIAWKREYMAPWDEFEAKCKELKAVLDGGISNLDTQIKGFEEAEINAKMDELHEYFLSVQHDDSREIADWEKIKAAHPRWKNKTYDIVQAKNDIQMDLGNIERGLAALRGMQEPYKAAMLAKFAETYRLDDAMTVMAQMQRQEAMEAERKRREEEAARQAAVKAAEAAVAESPSSATVAAYALASALEKETERAAAENAAQGNEEPVNVRRVEFWVDVTPEQRKALGRFLRESGIRYGAIRKEG